MQFTSNKVSNIPSVKASNKSEPPSTIYLEGYLNKQKHGKCKAFLKRYFVLYGEELRYYKTKEDTQSSAVISLDHYVVVSSIDPKQPKSTVSFSLISDDTTKYDWPDYNLQAPTVEIKNEWVDTLQPYVKQSTSVLDKWLDRLEITTEKDKSNQSIQIDTHPLTHSLSLNHHYSQSCSLLPSPITEINVKRRPSDYLLSSSYQSPTSLSNSIKFPKILTSWKTKSSNSSIASSNFNSSISLHEDDLPVHKKGIEVPIINPKDYDKITTDYYYK